ncbi:hypothetical protein H7I42_08270 [Mycolicibacterium vanbaalenii PYR-1]|uniref:Uncharacterized protein n=1 Tax=Mycolicibacterium vanbaalenii (strain DSM 7251 / JCM 13017 / BCRC 16820 / KCTC 9966 / NRRL B-24157 / PYR-1) TaxID=350058 RepID=A1T134_MYCVP|nr:hypothetical protein Mvan_0033 [Mycolicibacterium vanbaalenii PYR-1]MCV7127388.1 hypothetical protein [Mycolicibacterium vanbaalenii PYR-1]
MRTLTLQDVADLANVQRPVVSMWRNRPRVRGELVPFPEAVSRRDGIERFDPDAVVEYLKRTGRGNNTEVEYDAPAIAVPDNADLEELVVLLAWRVLTGVELAGTNPAERARLAEEYDPDDRCVLTEIRTIRPTGAVLEYVDELVEASFGLPDALARIEQGRLYRERAVRELTGDAVRILGRVVTECAVFLGAEDMTLRADGSTVSMAVAAECGMGVTSKDRAVLRRAVITGAGTGRSHAGEISFVSAVGLDAAAVLDRADVLVLGLEPGRIGVLVGPASALTDTLAGELQQRRADVLRVGNVMAAVRLPRGLWREAHRQNLALWVCLGGAEEQRPYVTDLAAIPDLDIGDFASDIAAALAQTDVRAFRYARRIDRAGVLAGGPFVPRGARAVGLSPAGRDSHVERVHTITLTTTTPLQPVDVLVEASPGRLKLRHRSLGELRDEGKLTLKRGNRIDLAHATSDGTVRVLPADDGLALDPVDAERLYPHSTRTEPGDVIFVQKPQPRAWVDTFGGAMVAAPARILRLGRTADLGPQVLAAVINETATAGSEWPSWTVPEMSADEAARLEVALADIAHYEAEARRRVEAARELKTALIDGVAAGALTLDAQPTTPGVAAADH